MNYKRKSNKKFENSFIPEKKIAYKYKHLFKSFSRNQLDFNSDNLVDTADLSCPSLLHYLSFNCRRAETTLLKREKYIWEEI